MSFWNKISLIGIKGTDSISDVRQRKLNNQVCLFTTLATLFFIPYLYFVGCFYYIPFEIATTLLIASSFLFNYFGFFAFSMYWRFFVVIADVSFASIEMPGAGFEFFLIPLGLIPFILSNEKPAQLALLSTAVIFFFLSMFVSKFYEPHFTMAEQTKTITYVIVLSMVFALCAVFVFKFKNASVNYEAVIHHQLKLIEQKNQDIMDSITYAKRIQRAMLPSPDAFQRNIPDFFVYYKPKDIVSGDFYWLEYHDNRIFIAVADCTGHGVPGAMMSVMCTNSLTRVVKELGVTKPSLILDKVAEITEEQFSGNTAMKDGMDISLCCIDTKNATIEFSGANKPLYRFTGGTLSETKADKQPIGMIDNRKCFTNHSFDLKKGDCYYLFSDGFSDQFGGPKGKKLSYKKFRKILEENYLKPMPEQRNELDRNFKEWKGELLQVDDVCVLGFKIS